MHPVIPYVTAAALFGLGVYGVLRRRNAILVLMAVELMLNAVNLIFVTADATVRSSLVGVQIEAWAYPGGRPHTGGVFALFVIVLAAAEIGVGLAIVLQYYRMRAAVAVDEILLDPPAEPAAGDDDAPPSHPADPSGPTDPNGPGPDGPTEPDPLTGPSAEQGAAGGGGPTGGTPPAGVGGGSVVGDRERVSG